MSKIRIMNELLNELRKGGPGSGNHGHAGRPGKKGGSASGEVSGLKPGVQFRPNDYGPLVEVVKRKSLYGEPGYIVRSPGTSREMFIPDKHITNLKIKEGAGNSPVGLEWKKVGTKEHEVHSGKTDRAEYIVSYDDGSKTTHARYTFSDGDTHSRTLDGRKIDDAKTWIENIVNNSL